MEELMNTDMLTAARNTMKELKNPTDLLRALSRDRPNPNFLIADTSLSLIESILLLKASSQPYSLTYLMP